MDFKAVNPTNTEEVSEVIELLDVSFPVDRDFIEREVTKSLASPEKDGQLYRLRSVDGDLIATVTYGQLYGDGWDGETFVRFFAVHPDHRRQGTCAWIIKKIMDDAQACGSRCVVLTSLQSDKIAAGIWERRGFTVYATQPCEEYPENGQHDCYVYWIPQEGKGVGVENPSHGDR